MHLIKQVCWPHSSDWSISRPMFKELSLISTVQELDIEVFYGVFPV